MEAMTRKNPAPDPLFDSGAPEHAPELYAHDAVAEKVNGLDAITDEHIAFYRQEGYLAVENAFTAEEVKAGLDGLIHLIMGGNPEFNGVSFEAKAKEILPTLGPDARQDAVRKLMYFVDYEERLRAMSHAPKLVKIVERLIGGKATMFQDMALLKPPRLGREKPWHQDHAYFDFPLGTRVLGVWIALDEATLDNGCMRVQPRKHLDGPAIHFKRRDWQICDTEIMGRKCVAAPLKPGGLLLFDGLLPHGTPTNHSPSRRRALQFHYAPHDVQKCPTEERLAHFGSEGKDVSC
jgi:phytanoyl-CoA hydroxylase